MISYFIKVGVFYIKNTAENCQTPKLSFHWNLERIQLLVAFLVVQFEFEHLHSLSQKEKDRQVTVTSPFGIWSPAKADLINNKNACKLDLSSIKLAGRQSIRRHLSLQCTWWMVGLTACFWASFFLSFTLTHSSTHFLSGVHVLANARRTANFGQFPRLCRLI